MKASVGLAALYRALGLFFRPVEDSTRRGAAHFSPKSILILKPCCLGDVLMATPVVAALRRAFPQAKIAFGVGTWSRAMVDSNPRLDEIVDLGPGLPRYPFKGHGDQRPSWGRYWGLVQRLRRQKFDACFVLDRSPLVSLMPFLAGIPNRVGLDSGGRGFSLTVRVPVRGVKHEAELYLDTVRALGIEPESPRLEYFPTEEERARAQERLDSLADPGSLVIALHPGGASNPGMELPAKRWWPRRFAAVADRLVRQEGATVLLVGARSDDQAIRAVAEAMHCRSVNLGSQLTLSELAALVERCDLYLGNDSGPTHLAVAVGTPVVAIYGPSDPRRYGPYGMGVAIASEEPCSPCFPDGGYRDCRHARCMAAVSVEQVWQGVERLLAQRKGGA